MVGKWAEFTSLEGGGSTIVRLMTIEANGTFYSVDISMAVDGVRDDQGKQVVPPGAEISSETGHIDLATGLKRMTKEEKDRQLVSTYYHAKDGELSVTDDMGTMGTQTIYYYKLATPPPKRR